MVAARTRGKMIGGGNEKMRACRSTSPLPLLSTDSAREQERGLEVAVVHSQVESQLTGS